MRAGLSSSTTDDGYVQVVSFSKFYGHVRAIENLDLGVREGELLALLGPSGSGKSTVLMSIAGFERPTSGDIRLAGRSIVRDPPHKRGIGVVFQRYALFPHLSVAENIAYPLRRRNLGREDIRREVERSLSLVQMDRLGGRYPTQLSGGQQQRVALARALVFRPGLLLLDEPLGALDRKLRQQLQTELKLIHQQVGTTMIMVTHDQDEALSLADRIAVLEGGRVRQLGTPAELYERPADAFVADFIGETNLLPAEVVSRSDAGIVVRLAGVAATVVVPCDNLSGTPGKRALLGIRPDDVSISPSSAATGSTILQSSYAGGTLALLVQHGPHRLNARVPTSQGARLPSGADVCVGFPQRCVRLYETDAA